MIHTKLPTLDTLFLFITAFCISSLSLLVIAMILLYLPWKPSGLGLMVYLIPSTWLFCLCLFTLKQSSPWQPKAYWLVYALVPWLVICLFLQVAGYKFEQPNILGHLLIHTIVHSVNTYSFFTLIDR